MAQTLWERLTRGPEKQIENPANAKIGAIFTIDEIDYRNKTNHLREIMEYKREINGKEFVFVDYVFDDFRLRFMPSTDDGVTHNIILLKKYDEMKFNESLDSVLREETGELVITENDNEEKYWRNNDVTSSYLAKINVLSGKNKLDTMNIEYWDFSRVTKDEADQDFTQYLFVELDKNYHMQTMWRGEEILAEKITIL